jgi:hypothetical protein
MPSTFTTNTGIEKPGDGEQAGLWGDTANLNFDIIDRAVNGVTSIVLATTSYTLTTSSGVLSPGQFAAITFTGTPGGTATVTVSPATAQKTYAIRNSTDQTIVITQGSGGNATILAGQSAVVACTGAGVSSAVFDITALMNTATSTNTASAIVQRDGSGNFAADTAALGGLSLGGTAVTATAAELNLLDGVTATTAEINTLDGIDTAGTGFGYVPQGGIIMWSGSVASIPTGWFLCDGTNGTPNLQNRFIVGAGDTHAPGATGGADSVTLAETNLPSHTHSFSATTGDGGAHTHAAITDPAGAHTHLTMHTQSGNVFGYDAFTHSGLFIDTTGTAQTLQAALTSGIGNHIHIVSVTPAPDHTHTVSGTTEATGSGTAFDNRPAFYALAFIMKA